MKNLRFTWIIALISLLGFLILTCDNDPGHDDGPDLSLRVHTIEVPEAGNYPQGLFKYAWAQNSFIGNYDVRGALVERSRQFRETLDWVPDVPKVFATNTQYSAVLTLEPTNASFTFEDLELGDIMGLPAIGGRVEDISSVHQGRNMIITIKYTPTTAENVPSKIIFEDDFQGTALDTTKWYAPNNSDRQGRSTWMSDMVSVKDGNLVLRFQKDTALGATKTTNQNLANNWLRAGAVRTQTANTPNRHDGEVLFQHNFGYYEVRMKVPRIAGTWGGFWLMSQTQNIIGDGGIDGAEIVVYKKTKT